jgi:molybdopterin/thiamine biosynthesis adenylyltransferase
MDLSKSYEFFQPEMCKGRVHVIGCGSVGSTVAELLARFGITNISLYDFDKVEPHNIANQMFNQDDLFHNKAEAVAHMICKINPDAEKDLKIYTEGYVNQKLNGYVFLCVDNIDLRRKIATDNKYNTMIKAMFDFRTRLTDAQHYAADWSDSTAKDTFLGTMNFTHEEAAKETPMSACHVTLSVAPTVRMICNVGVTNFVNFVKENKLYKMILVDAFKFEVDAIG